MRKKRLRTLTVLLGMILIPTLVTAEDVIFRVRVPETTPPGESISVVGNLPDLSEWNPGALEMAAVEANLWEITLDLPTGAQIEYKYTRGDWSNVEKSPDGSEMDNRTATVQAGLVIEDEVARWADVQPEVEKIEVAPGTELAVVFRVVVPENTPENSPVYISGDRTELGVWDGGFVEMRQVEPLIWEARVAFSDPGPAEYKYTRGDWGTVEKTTEGGERDNRKITVEPGAQSEDQVVSWADAPAAAAGQAVSAISNTSLSSKMMVNGRYVSKYISAREPDERYRLDRPSHDIRLDFLATAGPTISVWARASFFTGEHFHFSFDFDRAWAHVHPEEFDLKAFFNEEVVAFDDPFELVGHKDLRSTVDDDDIPFGRGTAGAEMRFHKLGMDFAGMVANVHDFDVRNYLDTYDDIGTDWLAGRASRRIGGFDLGFTGRRIRTANWSELTERDPPPPPTHFDRDEFGTDWFEINETDDVLTVDLARRFGGTLNLVLGAGYQKWQAAWVIGDAEERRYLGGHVKVDDEIGSSSGYIGLARAEIQLADNVTADLGFHREFLDSPGEDGKYLGWILQHREDANQHVFPIALDGHERQVDRTNAGVHLKGGTMDAGISISRYDDNRRAFTIYSDRHATTTEILPELTLRLGNRFEGGLSYLYERGTRFGMNDLAGILYPIQEWETGERFRFASEKQKVDTRILGLTSRLKITRRWHWDVDYQRTSLWRDYGDDRTVEVNGTYGVLFTAFTYEPRPGIQVQLGWGIDPVDDEDDRLIGRELWMRENFADWQAADWDNDGVKNYQDLVEWREGGEPRAIPVPTIGDLMEELSDTKQFMIKAKVKF